MSAFGPLRHLPRCNDFVAMENKRTRLGQRGNDLIDPFRKSAAYLLRCDDATSAAAVSPATLPSWAGGKAMKRRLRAGGKVVKADPAGRQASQGCA
jgi:hypothetical protein